MAVRAIRGAIQVDADDRKLILDAATELVTEVMTRNELSTDDVISVLAARKLGFHDVPLLCASEIDVPHALPRVIRLLAHIETDQPRSAIQHVYLRGATALRLDIAQ
jgi:chorismate mutase